MMNIYQINYKARNDLLSEAYPEPSQISTPLLWLSYPKRDFLYKNYLLSLYQDCLVR